MSDWERDDSGLSIADIERRQPYKMQPHHFKLRRRLPYPVCQNCGLVSLRNRLTAWCERMGCNAEDHPGYRAQVKATAERTA